LATDLFSPAVAAKLFSNKKRNLPPSKEGGEGDCGHANREDVQQRKAVSLRRQPFVFPCLVPATPGWGIAHYAMGQRRGIGFAGGKPLSVGKIDDRARACAL